MSHCLMKILRYTTAGLLLSVATVYTQDISDLVSLERNQQIKGVTHDDTDNAIIPELIVSEFELLTQLDFILSDLLIQCGNGTIHAANAATHVDSLTQVRATIAPTIATLQAKILADAQSFSARELVDLIRLNHTLCKSIHGLLSSHFKEPITFEHNAPTRHRPSAPTPEQLQQYVQENAQDFQEVQDLAKNAGLTWYNRLYRTIRPYTVEPINRHSLAIGLVIKSTLLGAYILHNTPANIIKEDGWIAKVPGLIRIKNFLGDAAGMKPFMNGQVFDPSTASTTPGQAIGWVNRCMSVYDPLGAMFATAAFTSWKGAYSHWYPKVAEKLTQLDNFLLGGIHRRQNTLVAYIPTIGLKDIVGMEVEKQQAELLIQSALNPEQFARAGATPPATILFMGGSRSGKTYFAEAIGGEIARRSGGQAYFLKVPAFILMELGFEALINEAKNTNIRVLFIDEFHRYFKHGANQNMLNGALTALNQAYDPKHPIIIICATNDPESLPHDLRNRFEVVLRFGKTTMYDRNTYLEQELRKAGISLESDVLQELVQETQGCSFESLQRLIKTAKRYALSTNQAVSEAHLLLAFDTEIRGIILESTKQISPAALMTIASNIGAEALMRLIHEPVLEEEVTAITIRAYNAAIHDTSLSVQWLNTTEGGGDHRQYGRVYTRALYDATGAFNIEQQKARCKVLIAGHAGEELLNGSCSYSYRADFAHKALKIALSIVSNGINVAEMTPEVRAQYEREAVKYLDTLKQEVKQELQQHQEKLFVLTIMLVQHGILPRRHIMQLLHPDAIAEIMQNLQKEMAQNGQITTLAETQDNDASPIEEPQQE